MLRRGRPLNPFPWEYMTHLYIKVDGVAVDNLADKAQ